jgi:hypothetical protein
MDVALAKEQMLGMMTNPFCSSNLAGPQVTDHPPEVTGGVFDVFGIRALASCPKKSTADSLMELSCRDSLCTESLSFTSQTTIDFHRLHSLRDAMLVSS